MYRWPRLNKKHLPNLKDAKRAMRRADAEGDARDVRPLMACLQRLVEADPRLAGHVLSRRSAVTSFSFRLDADREGAEESARRAARRLRPVIRDVMHHQLQAALYGAMVLRLSVDYSEVLDAQLARTEKVFPPTEIERPTSKRADLRLLKENRGGFSRQEVPSDGRHLTAIGGEHWIGGKLRQVLFSEILRHQTVTEWANFTRKLKGIIQAAMEGGVPPEGDPEREVAAKALRTMVEENYALTGDRTHFDFNKLVDAAGGQAFKQFKSTLESDIAIALLGQTGTEELPERGGSRAAVQVLNLIREDIHHADVRRTERIVNDQLLPLDYRLNVDSSTQAGGGSEEVPYRFSVQVGEEKDAESAARTVAEAREAGLPLLSAEVYDRMGFSVPEGVPEVLPPTGGAGGRQQQNPFEAAEGGDEAA